MNFSSISLKALGSHLLPLEHGRPFPPADDRAAWEALLQYPLNRARAAEILRLAEPLRHSPPPILPGMGYAEFTRSGDRHAYEKVYFQRRRDFAVLVLAYAFSGDDIWLCPLINLLVAICEETSWAVPAHVERGEPEDHIPDFASPTVALFSCETAATLAEGCCLLAKALDRVSPNLRKRVYAEIHIRILHPFEQRDDFFWMDGHNNWTPWCISSILIAASHTVTDPARLAALLHRALTPLERYLDQYPADGCDEEGPMYWLASPGVLILALEVLYARTGGFIDIYDHPKIAAMGRYPVNMHFGRGWTYSYSNARPKLGTMSARLYRFGERLQDPTLLNAARLCLCDWDTEQDPDPSLGFHSGPRCCGDLLHALRELFWIPADGNRPHAIPAAPVWYPDSQLRVAHAGGIQGRGMSLGIKGGHNGISHNHNDLGSFVVHSDGVPVIVDVGRSVYTRQNFGGNEERYGLWWNAGRGHDVLMINGIEQPPGGMYRSDVVEVCTEETRHSVIYELRGAYPGFCGLESWRRQAVLERGESGRVIITDRVRLREAVPLMMPLFTPRQVSLEPGRAVFSMPGEREVYMNWDPERLTVKPAELETRELPLIEAWGGHLQRLWVEPVRRERQQEWSLVFEGA